MAVLMWGTFSILLGLNEGQKTKQSSDPPLEEQIFVFCVPRYVLSAPSLRCVQKLCRPVVTTKQCWVPSVSGTVLVTSVLAFGLIATMNTANNCYVGRITSWGRAPSGLRVDDT